MKRRAFLGSLMGAFLAACTSDGSERSDVPDASAGAADNGATTSAPPSTPTTAAAPEPQPLPEVDALDTEPVDLPAEPFTLGVASGDPDATSVILWTRVLGAGLPSIVPMVWEVSVDESFSTLVATGRAEATTEHAHTVRAIASGLRSGTTFFYRFRAGAIASPVGRAKVLPALGDGQNTPLRLGVSSCQRLGDGGYAAHDGIAASNLDLMIWLGDYIYGRANTVDEYRDLYAEHRSDPLLQAAHASCAWSATWDDHEVANDYNNSVDQARFAAAAKAWWEHMPTRLPPPDPETGAFDLYRTIDLGDHGRLLLTDVRQHADGATLLGPDQEDWLASQLDHDGTWTLVGSPVLVSGLLLPVADNPLFYTYDGYPNDRARLAARVASIPGTVFLSGDLHTSMSLLMSADPADNTAKPVATELMAPAISSAFPEDLAGAAPLLGLVNPHLQGIDPRNGFLRLTLSADRALVENIFYEDTTDPSSVAPAPPMAIIPTAPGLAPA